MAAHGSKAGWGFALAVLLLADASGFAHAQEAAAPECDQNQAPGSVTSVKAYVVDSSTVDVSVC